MHLWNASWEFGMRISQILCCILCQHAFKMHRYMWHHLAYIWYSLLHPIRTISKFLSIEKWTSEASYQYNTNSMRCFIFHYQKTVVQIFCLFHVHLSHLTQIINSFEAIYIYLDIHGLLHFVRKVRTSCCKELPFSIPCPFYPFYPFSKHTFIPPRMSRFEKHN